MDVREVVHDTEITVILNDQDFDEQIIIENSIDVLRDETPVDEVYQEITTIEQIVPGNTVSNVNAGPELPENPYEGQVWILT
jgi:hypothetical protein